MASATMEQHETNNDTSTSDYTNQSFYIDYEKFKEGFDEIIKDQFQGIKIEKFVMEFIQKYQKFLDTIPFALQNSKFPNCTDREAIDEDTMILGAMMSNNTDNNNDANEKHNLIKVTKLTHIAADIYWRASQGVYLRTTYNKSRLNQDDDRIESLRYARMALRYDPTYFRSVYWYMITLGWYVDSVNHPKLRIIMAQGFRDAALYTIQLNPNDYLAYNLLGRYQYEIANLGWLERTVSKGLLGYKLEATFEEARRNLMIAYELRPSWLPHGRWLAKCCLGLRRPMDEVMHWIDYGLAAGLDEPCNEIERKDLLEMKAKYGSSR